MNCIMTGGDQICYPWTIHCKCENFAVQSDYKGPISHNPTYFFFLYYIMSGSDNTLILTCFLFTSVSLQYSIIKMEGWMTCDFTSCSTVFQSYQDYGRLIMKGSMQWNSV